jgi:hypothetical protein
MLESNCHQVIQFEILDMEVSYALKAHCRGNKL